MTWYKPWTWGDESASSQQKRNDLNAQGAAAGGFAGAGEQNYGALGAEADQARGYLRDLAMGKNSLVGEQLRQNLEQNVATQRSFAASASPQNAPMAARTAAIQAGRMGTGLGGAAVEKGIMERNAAQQAYLQALLQQRQQEANVALGSRGTAVNAYGGVTPEQSTLEKWANPIAGGVAAGAKLFSDQRLKEDVGDGDVDADKALKGLRAYTYKYKNDKYGKGKQLGVMAQDLERVGLKQAVIDTPEGKAVDVGKLSGANTAMLSALARRVEKLEGKKG